MKRSRRLLLFALPAGTLAVIAAGWLLWPMQAPPGVSLETFNRIHAGMSEAEVEYLFGAPGTISPPHRNYLRPDPRNKRWKADGATVIVIFTPTDQVNSAIFIPVDAVRIDDWIRLRGASESLLDRLRRWLGS